MLASKCVDIGTKRPSQPRVRIKVIQEATTNSTSMLSQAPDTSTRTGRSVKINSKYFDPGLISKIQYCPSINCFISN